ncbi:MAG: hypothetical protein EXR71_13110 [Myxococcales bacterium]|nr:hypothetical protein [Myxococcales bacterium]
MARDRGDAQETGTNHAQHQAAIRVREAFAAILKDAKTERMYLGTDLGKNHAIHTRFRAAFILAMRDALQEMPVVLVDVTPDGLLLGDHVIVAATERRGDIAEVLFSEGLRALSVDAAVSDDELVTMARLLVTPWQNRGPGAADLATTAWESDFSHVHFAVVDSLADRDNEQWGESPIVRALQGLVAELNARADEGADAEIARLRQDELAVLLRLQDHVEFDGSGDETEELLIESDLTPGLVAELNACRADADMARADVAGLLTALLRVVTTPDAARTVGEALYSYVVNAVLVDGAGSGLAQRTAELLDADLTPHLPHRDTMRGAAAVLATEPTRSRLGRLAATSQPREAAGLLFTLFLLLPGEDEAISLAEALPVWAVRVLADTVLLRAAPEPLVATDVSKRFLARPERGALVLGLAMAARQNDPRLIESVLLHAANAADDVREAVLVALRHQQTPKIRDVVRGFVADPSESVRLEALRNCVAYRDLDVLSLIEGRLLGTVGVSDAELRALCISFARIGGANVLPLLVEIADGSRPVHRPALPRLALHGVKALGTEPSRSALGRIALVVPTLADEVRQLLGEGR